MTKVVSKNMKKSLESYKPEDLYDIKEAVSILKKITNVKFDASVDISINLNINPSKADQMVRSIVVLPNGTGKTKKILALVTADLEEKAKLAKADYVGLDEYIEKIKKDRWLDFDVIVTVPSIMPKLASLGKILGPRGLMPNPKTGTVTDDISKSINEIKKGKISFKSDKNGIVHACIGKISFEDDKIVENANEFISTIIKLKPSSVKQTYLKSISLSTTMSPSVKLNIKKY